MWWVDIPLASLYIKRCTRTQRRLFAWEKHSYSHDPHTIIPADVCRSTHGCEFVWRSLMNRMVRRGAGLWRSVYTGPSPAQKWEMDLEDSSDPPKADAMPQNASVHREERGFGGSVTFRDSCTNRQIRLCNDANQHFDRRIFQQKCQ